MRRLLAAALLVAAVATGCARDEARPAGITERWLQAVSEQGREGLREDAVERAERYGSPEAAAKVRPADAEEDERTFSDLEVGKAAVDLDQARVPFRLTARIDGGERRELEGAAVLVRSAGRWSVVDVVARVEGEEVPSEGGERPARAKVSHWLFAVAFALGLTAVSIFLIERQPAGTPSANSR
jgi:hypothetical protein